MWAHLPSESQSIAMSSRFSSAFGLRLFGGAFIPLLAVAGLLLTPVSCMCGASVPHGHSLFQLPYHHHGANHNESDSMSESHGSMKGVGHVGESDGECDGHRRMLTFDGNFALSNLAEQSDGAALKAPPSSSFGHAMAMTQPTFVSMSPVNCESIDLPPARMLEGTQTSPETPPPRL